MKKILITGANSYIGTSFENYLKKWQDEYQVDTVDMIDDSWREKSFSGYDAVFHVAGIAHQKETKENKDLYYKVNSDLAIETAKKAKEDNVKQFVLLSTMSVYGMNVGVIHKETAPNPKTHYGKSKLEAENGLIKLSSDRFKIAIVRPPMVYGYNCKGNFQTLVKIVKKSPVFPYVNNKRSAIYIANLCEFVRKIIDNELSDIFFPQDSQYLSTSQAALLIAEALNKKIFFSRMLGLFVRVGIFFHPKIRKAFGTLYYDESTASQIQFQVDGVDSSIKKSLIGG